MLGYAIGADRGPDGGYRLARGRVVPPLLLSDDEAVAMALALRTVGAAGLRGQEETVLRTLVKLEGVLPAAARERVGRLTAAIRTEETPGVASVDVDLLASLADAIGRQVQARLSYTDRQGAVTERRIEPHRLVSWRRRWYLVAHDLDRDGWRTFRLDRVADVRATSFRFTPRPGEPDLLATLPRPQDPGAFPHRVEVLVAASLDDLPGYADYFHQERVDAATTRMVAGVDDVESAASWVMRIEHPLTVVGDDAVRGAVAEMAARAAAMLA